MLDHGRRRKNRGHRISHSNVGGGGGEYESVHGSNGPYEFICDADIDVIFRRNPKSLLWIL